MDNYHTYSKNKKLLSINHKGVDLGKVMAFDIAYRSYGNKFSLLKDFFGVFCVKRPEFKGVNRLLVSMGPYGRKNYYEIEKNAIDGLEYDFVDFYELNWTPYFSFKNLISTFVSLIGLKLQSSLAVKLSMIFKMVHFKNHIDIFYDELSMVSYNKYCSFCCAHAYESILSQVLRSKKTTTYTLQHGLYYVFDNPPVDVINYENFASDFMLCWGEYTRDELIRYGVDSEKLFVAGYPVRKEKLRPYSVSNGEVSIVILCSRVKYDANNFKILSIARQLLDGGNLKLKVSVKLHPSLDVDKYAGICKEYGFDLIGDVTISELLNSGVYRYSISYNSTAYLDSYLGNCISFRYSDDEDELKVGILNDKFSDVKSLEFLISHYAVLACETELWQMVEDKLKYFIGYGINKYKLALE